MSERSLMDFVTRVVAQHGGVRIDCPDGQMFAHDTDGTSRVCLRNDKGQIRGVWFPWDDLMQGFGEEQLMLDLTEACDKLTDLMKETDE